MTDYATMSFDDWWDKYRPTGNPVEQSGPTNDIECRMFETFGPDIETACKAANDRPQHVWTLVECDGKQYVLPGYRLMNRMGYYITEVACENESLEVELDDEADVDRYYQPKAEFMPEDMASYEVFRDLDNGLEAYPGIPVEHWLEFDCSELSPIEDPVFLD